MLDLTLQGAYRLMFVIAAFVAWVLNWVLPQSLQPVMELLSMLWVTDTFWWWVIGVSKHESNSILASLPNVK